MSIIINVNTTIIVQTMSTTPKKALKNAKDNNQDDTNEKAIPGKLDKTKESDIKEKIYTTRQVETSVTLLDSPESDIVLEALLFLSKYADINRNNLISLIKIGIIEKLLMNFNKNICILRLSLRLISVLANSKDGLYEIDQEKYDEKIIDIVNMYMDHKDAHVKEFCVEILAKVANSCRMAILIFKVDLLNPIFDHIKSAKNPNLLYYSMLLLFELINAPAAVCALTECLRYDPNIILNHMNNKEQKISNLALDILEKLSRYALPFLQQGFKKLCLMEKMFKLIMDENKKEQHDIAIKIIHNCLNSEETHCYFVESLEFLELCHWLKTCHPKYLLPLIEVFVTVTSIPELKQMLFDLSVEECILYFFRFNNKKVINKTCEAVSNMTTHIYCCEHMLTPVVAATLIEILQRNGDEEDPYNEIPLRTVFHFIRRYIKAQDIFLSKNFKPVLLDYFFNKSQLIKANNFVMVVEIMYRYLVHPIYQDEFVTEETLQEILKLFQKATAPVSTLCCEIMASITTLNIFRNFFLNNNGPRICIDVLKSTEDGNLITHILYFIFSCLSYEELAMALLRQGLLPVLRNFDKAIMHKIPICKKVMHLALAYYPPIHFYETGQMEITDKIPNKFYVINGLWNGPFPFLEILEKMRVSPYPTIYIVDYSYEVVTGSNLEITSQSTLRSSSSSLSRSTASSLSRSFSEISLPKVPSALDINYGHISQDVFLPRYIYHIKKYEKYMEGCIEDRIRFLAEYVDTLLCGPKDNLTLPQKIHEYKLHIECLKHKLGNNIIPIGLLRLGFHCERALLFKALADKICIPCSLIKGNLKIYWNEVALFERNDEHGKIKFYVVDLMFDVGKLMLVGSREANKYCNLN